MFDIAKYHVRYLLIIRTELEGGCYKEEYDDGRIYYYDSACKIHRLDGPAWYLNGKYYYFIMGKEYTKEEYDKIMLVELWKWLNNE